MGQEAIVNGKPFIEQSPLTGRWYFVQSWRPLPNGDREAWIKHDITEQIEAVEAAVRADMPREVQTVEYRAVAMYPETRDVVDSAAVAPSVEDALNSAEVFGLAESNADIPNLIIGVQQRTKAGPWLPVTPSTPNQQGAEQK